MWSVRLLTTALALGSLATCTPYPRAPLRRYAYDGTVADAYDFVIVGGGLAGLALASRLTEDSNTTVLVLEAGDSGELVQSRIDTPAFTYYNGLVGSTYDWAYQTVPQSEAGNRALSWPRGKVLGGSSAINGMYHVRPTEIEVNAWQSMIAPDDTTAAESWTWDSLHAAMEKSETFTAPSDDVKSLAGIQFNADTYGSSGPLHASYPGYEFGTLNDFQKSLAAIGVPPNADAASGKNSGAYVTPSYINPTNWTRSYSRRAYIDPLPPRSNLNIVVNATVTRIVFSSTKSSNGDVTATGVEYVLGSGSAKSTVNANREVILSSGAIGSPHLLLVSGVGPKDVLDSAGVTVQVELPGVGQHLQDHLSTYVMFNATVDTAGSIYAAKSATASSPEFLSYINSATAYVNTTFLLGSDGVAAFQQSVDAALPAAAASKVPSQYAEVIEGYKAIYNVTADTIIPGDVGTVEILLNMMFAGGISISAALQHPFSQGHLYINSSSISDPPLIDPNYLTHPADLQIMREALKLARKVGQTEPLASSLGGEVSPGSSVSTDDEWDAWLINQVGTEYHPSATCSMLPKAQGGVVNAKLQVYGTSNVRVVDASVFPFTFSAHLMAPTYGVAEEAANIIRTQYNTVSTTSSSSPSGTADSSTTTSGSSEKSGAAGMFAQSLSGGARALLFAVMGVLFAL